VLLLFSKSVPLILISKIVSVIIIFIAFDLM